MASVIIPAKTADGKTTSVSIDADLFNLLAADFKTTADARAWVRDQAAKFKSGTGAVTRQVRFLALHRIAKPSLSCRAMGGEAQLDIEEV